MLHFHFKSLNASIFVGLALVVVVKLLFLENACFLVCPLPSACEHAHVLSGMRPGLWALYTIL